jgi:hypothetical protein
MKYLPSNKGKIVAGSPTSQARLSYIFDRSHFLPRAHVSADATTGIGNPFCPVVAAVAELLRAALMRCRLLGEFASGGPAC